MDLMDIGELLAALDGLEDHVRKALLDSHGRVRADKIDDLRRRSTYLDFAEGDPQAPLAVSNAFAHVAALAVALEDAQRSGLHIAIG